MAKRRVASYGIPERVFFALLSEFQHKILVKASQERQRAILERQNKDIMSMLRGEHKSGDTTGRVSGSEEWRRERGELGNTTVAASAASSCDCNKSQIVSEWLSAHKPEVFFSADNFGGSVCERINIVGSAHPDATKKSLVITENVKSQCGAAWIEVAAATVLKAGVMAEFRYVITDPFADGFAFVLQAHSPDALGKGGSQLGYGGIPCSVAVEFDNYLSRDSCEDPNDNHVSVNTRYDRPNTAHHAASIAMCSDLSSSIADGNPHDVAVVFTHDRVEVWLDKKHVIHVHKWDMEKLLAGKQNCWVGFTGATGGLSQRLDVLSLTLCTVN